MILDPSKKIVIQHRVSVNAMMVFLDGPVTNAKKDTSAGLVVQVIFVPDSTTYVDISHHNHK